MNRIVRVYVAGPYTHPDPVENTHRAVMLGDELLQAGYCPYIPHLNLLWHIIRPRPAADWYAYDKHWLVKCDVVLRMPGLSVGADGECALARMAGIPIVDSIDALKERFPVV